MAPTAAYLLRCSNIAVLSAHPLEGESMRKYAIFGALVAAAISTAAWAAQQDFVIVNHTGQAVLTLNVSPSDENTWGPDILGVDILANGERADVTFDNNEDRCECEQRQHQIFSRESRRTAQITVVPGSSSARRARSRRALKAEWPLPTTMTLRPA
jgi:hypothetical protein